MRAARTEIDTIAITRPFDGIEAAAHRVISQVGGMASVIKNMKLTAAWYYQHRYLVDTSRNWRAV